MPTLDPQQTRPPTPTTLRVAAIQMVSGLDRDRNLADAQELIAQAASEGAELVALPEFFCQLGGDAAEKLAIAERAGEGPVQSMLSASARRHGIWLVGGSIPLRTTSPRHVSNTLLTYGPDGALLARYDKCNLFSIRSENFTHDESLTMTPGRELVTVDTPWGRIGFGICYDLRFPALFEKLGAVDLIVLPSAFTHATGAAHWELLLRARAVDNQCFVLAPAQGGLHECGRRTWGRTTAVGPWSDVIGRLEEGPGVLTVDLEIAAVAHARSTLPVVRDRASNRALAEASHRGA